MSAKKKQIGRPANDPATPESLIVEDASPARHGWLIGLLTGLHMLFLALIVLAMTPLTHNLDDIKVLIYFWTGPVLMTLAAGALILRLVPNPPRIATWGLAAYILVFVISVQLSRFSWIGRYELMMTWANLGFFLSAFCIGAHQRASEAMTRYFMLLFFVTVMVAFMMFDFRTAATGQHHSVVSEIYRLLYSADPTENVGRQSAFHILLRTLANADTTMQSTILNRDFFAAFCLLYIPFALLLALEPGRRHQAVWVRIVSLIALTSGIVAIFYCRSKGEYLMLVVVLAFFLASFSRISRGTHLRRQYVLAWGGGIVLLLMTMGLMISPVLMAKLKTLDVSVTARAIIWAGSLEIFKDFPILGAGPGTFRIYFPAFRAPDYFNHEISNVTLFSHNYFLDVLCETGLLGMAAFLVFLGALALAGLRWMFKHPDARTRVLLLAVLAGLMGIFGSNLSSPNGRWVIGASSIWTMLGFLAGLIRQADLSARGSTPAKEARVPLPTWQSGVAWGMGVLALITVLVGFSRGARYFDGRVKHAEGLYSMEVGTFLMQNASNNPAGALNAMREADEKFEQALEIDPDNISGYYKRASTQSRMAMLIRQLALQARRSGNLERAEQLNRQARFYTEQAMESYEELAELAPDYAEIHFNFGIIYDEYATGLEERLNAGDENVTEEMIDAYRRKALEHLDRMGELSIKDQVAMLRGQQMQRMGYEDRAIGVYREALKIYPNNENLVSRYLVAAQQSEDPSALPDALFRRWSLDTSNNGLLNWALREALERGQDDLLADALDRLESINPIDPRIFQYRVLMTEVDEQPEAVLESARNFVKVGGRDPSVLRQGIEAATRLQRPEDADLLRQALGTG